MNDNTKHCKEIAERLEAICEGRAYKDDYQGIVIVDNIDDMPEDCEEYTIWDCCLDGVYDIEYRLNSDREYKSVAFMVACGGPNIWIDTGNCKVELYWWGDYAYWTFDREVANEIDSVYEEIYSC